MTIVFIALGSNLGDRYENLKQARQRLKGMATLIRVSSLYETEPWGYADQPTFVNQVVKIESELSPQRLLNGLKRIEKQLGRVATFRYGPRVIDLDILFYGEQVVNTSRLKIPHPKIPERPFVLIPMAEIAPDWVHPILNKTIQQLLDALPDSSKTEVSCKPS